MFRKANNVFSVILDDNAQPALALAAGTLITDANLPKGAIAAVDLGNGFLTAAAFAALVDGDQYRIVQGKGLGQQIMKTPVLTVGKTKFTINPFKPAVQQVTIIGYNGTTGALPTANDTDFWIKIRKRDNDAANRSQPMSLFAGPVRTDATGTQAELATLLVANGYLNFKNEPANHYLKFEAICSDAGALDVTAVTANVTLNSKGVTLVAAPTTMVAGDFIRFGTTVNDPVYRIDSIVGTALTLATPYTGDTATGVTIEYVTAALAALPATNFGIKITGIAAPFNVNTFRDYYANRFTATFSNSSVLVTPFVGARNGNGVWQQVAMDEYLSYGYEGQNQQLATPSIARDQDVKIPGVTAGATALTSKYSCLNIAWTEDIRGLVSVDNGLGNAVIYLNLENSGGTGVLAGSGSSGEELVTNLGLTAADFNQ
jgi:hypothetical protein